VFFHDSTVHTRAHQCRAVSKSGAPYCLGVVTPVFNDWTSLCLLMQKIAQLYDRHDFEFSVAVVDDGSTEPAGSLDIAVGGQSCIRQFQIIRLATNLGHQRAIAMGLAYLAGRTDIDAVIVMDSDGEDRPEEIASLATTAQANPGAIVLAERSKRSESRTFKFGYLLYRLLFRVLTGQSISSGNFSLIPFSALKALVHSPTLWNNLPATLVRSRYRMVSLPTVRGVRYSGQSKMNIVSLIIHGMSGISVYVDVIFVRLLLASAALMIIALAGTIFILFYKLFTNLATPGWATTVISTFLIILLQSGIFVVGTTLVLLGGRSNHTVIPGLDWRRFVEDDQGLGHNLKEFSDHQVREVIR
jgi:glycosyltransferase involved in cell wall biosynthesis